MTNVTPLFPTGQPTREPPHNFDAEQALLGAILCNNLAYPRVSEFLRPEHFASAVHGRVFASCASLIGRGNIANPLTLKSEFDQDPELQAIGGAQYLARLAASATTIINAADYGRIVHDLWQRRLLIEVGEGIVNGAFDHDPTNSAAQQIEQAQRQLSELSEVGGIRGGLRPVSDFVDDVMTSADRAAASPGAIMGFSTGLIDLDDLTGGFSDGELIILAARPGMGKTALACSIALNAAKRGEPQGFFTLEMPCSQITRRLISVLSGVPVAAIKRGRFTPEERARMQNAARELRSLPLFLDDAVGIHPSLIRSRLRNLKRRHGCKAVWVDHIQIMSGGQGRYANRTAEITDITKGLKQAAKEIGCPIVALAQLNRGVEGRDDKRPTLADLRESGSIEQDADVVLFIYREEYYHRKAEPDRLKTDSVSRQKHTEWEADLDAIKGIAEVIAAKQRDDAEGRRELYFDAELIAFGNLAKRQGGHP